MAYKVIRLWHPSHRVPGLAVAKEFFENFFGRPSIPVETCLPPVEEAPNYPRDYGIFTILQEVFFDSIDPSRYVVEGRQTYEDTDVPHLNCLGWAVEGTQEIYDACIAAGIRSTDQANRIGGSKKAPVTGFSPSPLFFTLPESTGLRYQIYPLSSTGYPDPRTQPGWKLPPVSESDPLSLEFCSHHTILTSTPSKGLNFLVGILHGKIIHQGFNKLLETNSTFISLGDGVYELAVPTRQGSFAAEDLKFGAPFDTYSSMTFKVKDLSKVERHLASRKVKVLFRDDHTVTNQVT